MAPILRNNAKWSEVLIGGGGGGGGGGGEGVLNKVLRGTSTLRSNPLPLLLFLSEKGIPFVCLLMTNCTSFSELV